MNHDALASTPIVEFFCGRMTFLDRARGTTQQELGKSSDTCVRALQSLIRTKHLAGTRLLLPKLISDCRLVKTPITRQISLGQQTVAKLW